MIRYGSDRRACSAMIFEDTLFKQAVVVVHISPFPSAIYYVYRSSSQFAVCCFILIYIDYVLPFYEERPKTGIIPDDFPPLSTPFPYRQINMASGSHFIGQDLATTRSWPLFRQVFPILAAFPEKRARFTIIPLIPEKSGQKHMGC